MAQQPPARALARLLGELNLLNLHAVSPRERLGILDCLRAPAHEACSAAARKFAWRALPLATSEQAALDANVALANALSEGYRLCLDEYAARQDATGEAARIAEHSLAALAWMHHDLLRAAIEPPAGFWQALHRLYAQVEALGLGRTEVQDPLFDIRATTPAAVYVHVLLLDRAATHELGPAHFETARRRLAHWSRHLRVLETPPARFALPPLVSDLSGAAPPGHVPPASGRLRYVDPAPLALKLKRRIDALQQAAGEAIPVPPETASRADEPPILRHLYVHCCKGAVARSASPLPGDGVCGVATGIEAAHYYLSGSTPFRPPQDAAALSRFEAEKIATLRMMEPLYRPGYSRQHGFRMQTWQLAGESATQLHIERAVQCEGRIARGQLVLLKRGRDHALGCVRWVRMTADAVLCAAVRPFPGVPRPVAMRPAQRAGGTWQPALVVADADACTLIGPRGSLHAAGVIDLLDSGPRSAKLAASFERGTDFERAAYESR